jgi:hypothetical protein
MINYTQKQLSNLINELFNRFLYHGLLITPETDHPLGFPYDELITEKLKVPIRIDTNVIHDNWSNFKKKIPQNHNTTPRDRRQMIRRMYSTLFKIPLYKLPLHINDPVTGPIVAWRLRNTI